VISVLNRFTLSNRALARNNLKSFAYRAKVPGDSRYRGSFGLPRTSLSRNPCDRQHRRRAWPGMRPQTRCRASTNPDRMTPAEETLVPIPHRTFPRRSQASQFNAQSIHPKTAG
jgi:hypothetical protein